MIVKKIWLTVLISTVLVFVTACSSAITQSDTKVSNNKKSNYPTKSLEFEIAYGLGGGADSATRQIAPEVEKALGQKIKISNKPGASGVVATNQFTKGKPDGYTILIHGMPSINLSTLLFSDQVTYKMDDLIPIASWINADGNALVVPKESPMNSLDDFIKAAKSKPLSVSTGGGMGSTDHSAVVTLEKAAGIDLNMVPFNSAGDAATAIIGKHVDAGFVSLTSTAVSKENFKFLAVTTDKRVTSFPDLPTFAELGYPQMTLAFHVGAFALKGTPKEELQILESAFQKAFASDSYQNWAKTANKPIGEFKGLDAFGQMTTNATKTMQDILPQLQEDVKKSNKK